MFSAPDSNWELTPHKDVTLTIGLAGSKRKPIQRGSKITILIAFANISAGCSPQHSHSINFIFSPFVERPPRDELHRRGRRSLCSLSPMMPPINPKTAAKITVIKVSISPLRRHCCKQTPPRLRFIFDIINT